MTTPSLEHNELRGLIASMREDVLTPDQASRLNDILDSSPDAREVFAKYSLLQATIELAWSDKPIKLDDESSETTIPFDVPSLSPLPSPLSPPFVGSPAFSYMVATVVLCLMLLGAWAYKISHAIDSQIAGKSRRSTTSGPVDQQELFFVGKITGMKDCQWSDPATGTIVGASIPLDREYALTSGLMEITYTSGAKVIIEGPCTYKVDSDAGGYLAVGKLTARVETKGSGCRVQGSEDRDQRTEVRGRKSHPSSFIPHPSSLFSIRTPTALVTDLGTEFGVEVDENGDTVSHVFQGSISVQGLSASAARGATKKVLRINESIRVSRVRETHHESAAKAVRFTHPAETPKFARRMPARRMTNGSMSVMDSTDFTWRYEMDVDPTVQDLDAHPGPDWTLVRGAVQVNGDGTATLAASGDYTGSLISAGTDDPQHETGHVWNNINPATGYTVELRVKVLKAVAWHGHNLGLHFFATDSTAENLAMVVLAKESTLCGNAAKYLIDNNPNDDDFHVFRIAQEPDSGKYRVWRDGLLVRLSDGIESYSWNRVQFGDIVKGGGLNEVDYVRITAGAYAPPKRPNTAHAPDGVDATKEMPPMEH